MLVLSKLFNKKEDVDVAPGFLVLTYSSHGLSIVACKRLLDGTRKAEVVDISFIDREISGSYNSEEHILETMVSDLSAYVKEKGFEGYDSVVVLSSDEYVIKMIEKPTAENNEIKNALKFSIQDFVDYGFDNTIVDYVDLPLQRRSDSSGLVFAVCMPKDNMEKIANIIEETGLRPFCIDIPEMSKMHLFNYIYPTESMAVILHIDVRYCQVMVLYNGDMLVIRSIDLGLSVESDNEDWEEVSLEVQRSIDYAGNIFGQQIQSKLYVFPTKESLERGLSFISYDLGIDIEGINLDEQIDYIEKFSDNGQDIDILAIGQVSKVEIIKEEHDAVN